MQLALDLPAQVKYQIYTLDSPDRLVLELQHARYGGALPDISTLTAVHALRQRVEEDGTYRLVLESSGPLHLQQAGLERSAHGYELRVDLASLQTAAAGPAPVDMPAPVAVSRSGSIDITPVKSDGVEKLRVSDDDTARTDAIVRDARRLYTEGSINDALNRLLRAVKQDPGHVKARSTLAVMLYEQGQNRLATYILNEGLRLQPHQPEWVKILARALYSEGKPDQALALLAQDPPPVKGHTEYHALYAGILQEKGRHEQAAVEYRNLLREQGSNGAWWMGLAISLEALSRKSDAIVAYKNALNTPQLNADSLRFVKQRLNHLNQNS